MRFFRKIARRVWRDLRAGQHLDTYVAVAVAVVFAVLGVINDVIPNGVKWSALFAGIGVLLYRTALSDLSGATEQLLADRDAFADAPFRTLLTDAVQLWIFAPSAVNVLNPQHCQEIRQFILDRGSGDVRVAVLDPANTAATALAVKQLDESLQYPLQDFVSSQTTVVKQLRKMAAWNMSGRFSYRFVDYNPGFSMVAVNPSRRDGRIVVEFHGYRNEAVSSRMHLTLTRHDSERWFQYWVQQFEAIWSSARPDPG
jgi:hypothetical protein